LNDFKHDTTPAAFRDSAGPDQSGILDWRDVREQIAENGWVCWNRQSGRVGRGPLRRKTAASRWEIERRVHRPALETFQHTGTGSIGALTADGKLEAACRYAARRGAVLLASDINRYLRWPTPERWARHQQLRHGAVLAVLEPIDLAEHGEGGLHSQAVKRTGRCGRPRSIDDETAEKIVRYMEVFLARHLSGPRYAATLRETAEQFRVTEQSIRRVLARVSPDGRTWRDVIMDRTAEADRRDAEHQERLERLRNEPWTWS
jgi:hypothetical protein